MIQRAFREVLDGPLRNGVYKPKAFHGSGVPVINMKELFAFDRSDGQASDRVVLTPRELERVSLRPGDLLFARRSFVLEGAGKCSIVRSLPEPTTFESSMIRARLDRERADPEFFYYFFRSPHGRNAMSSIATRTAVSGITGQSLTSLDVPVPAVNIQRKIATVLAAYDDLVENATQRIKVLEETAERIYREWFVDFRYPGHNDVPLVDSPLGPLPRDWGLLKVDEWATVVVGSTPSRKEPAYWTDGDIAWVNSSAVNQTVVVRPSEMITRQGFESTSTKLMPRGSTLVAITGATLGQVSYLALDACGSQNVGGIFGTRWPRYMYWRIRDDIRRIANRAMGGAQQHINRRIIAEHEIVKPTEAVLDRFEAETTPIIDAIVAVLRQQAVLTRTRDLVLPRLVSGEIDVGEVDIAGGE